MPEPLVLPVTLRSDLFRHDLRRALTDRRIRGAIRAVLSRLLPGRWPASQASRLATLERAMRRGDAVAAGVVARWTEGDPDAAVPGRPAALRRAAALEVLARDREPGEARAERGVAAYLRGEFGPRAHVAATGSPRQRAQDAADGLRAGGHDCPVILATFPGWQTNPYGRLMEQAYAAGGLAAVDVDAVDGVDEIVDAARVGNYRVVVHLNAPDRFVGPVGTEPEAEAVAAAMLAHIGAWVEHGAVLVWSVHNGPRLASHRSIAERLIAQGIADRAHLVHILAGDTADLLAGWVDLDPARVVHVAHPSYDGIYGPMPSRASARTTLGISDDEPEIVVGLVGTLAGRKGVPLLLDALDLAPDPLPGGGRLRVVIAGMLAAPRNEQLVRRTLLNPRVTAHFGFVPDDTLPTILAALDVAVVPYEHMLNSGWLHLALTAGLPVLAPLEGTAPSIVNPQGLRTFHAGDPVSLAAALTAVPELATTAARAAARASLASLDPYTQSTRFVEAVQRSIEHAPERVGVTTPDPDRAVPLVVEALAENVPSGSQDARAAIARTADAPRPSRRARWLISAAHRTPKAIRVRVARACRRIGAGDPSTVVIAAWASGDLDAAGAHARRIGTAREADSATRRSMAILARELGLTDAAIAIVAASPDDPAPVFAVDHARIALAEGRYTEAIRRARRAARPGYGSAASVAAQADGRLAALRPGWTPDLGADAIALGRVRPPFTRGRVLHLVAATLPYRQAGYTIRTRDVTTAQREAGLDPHVVARAGFPGRSGDGNVPAVLDVEGIPYHFPAPDFRGTGRLDDTLAASARATIPLLDALRPAVLQAASNHEQAQVALALARPIKIPVVYEVRGFWEDTWVAESGLEESLAIASDRYRLTRGAETAAMLAADAVVTLSETMAAEVRLRGIPAHRVNVVPNAVDPDRFQPGPRDPALAASVGIEPGDVVVGYVTSITAYEGIPILLEAAARLRPSRRLKVLVVGEGPHLDDVRSAATALGLDDGTLVLPGRVAHSEVAAWYRLIDVFVVPRLDTRVTRLVTPLKPYEAMALEIPVVTSDLPALREMLVPGETGAVFAAGDARALEEALGPLIDDEALRQRLGRNAREWVLANRSWTANGIRYRELFERLGAA